MRLIDADALMPLFIKKACTMKDRHGVKLGEDWLLNYNDIKDVITSAPAIITARTTVEGFPIIDMRPRNTGEWIREGEVHSKCSLCGFKYADYGILFDYCPNCGARMEADNENY